MNFRYICACLQASVLLLWALPAFSEKADEPVGIFLVAKRGIEDPNFRETVVLVRPIPGGAIGVILNRPTDITLSKLFPDSPVLKENKNNVYVGGPVYPRSLVFMFRSNEKPQWALHMMDDVYLGLSVDQLQKLLSSPQAEGQLKIYAGHSGWGQGQLQNEIERGDWFITAADAGVVFEMKPEKIWPELIKRASTRSVNAEQLELLDKWVRGTSKKQSLNRPANGFAGMLSSAFLAGP